MFNLNRLKEGVDKDMEISERTREMFNSWRSVSVWAFGEEIIDLLSPLSESEISKMVASYWQHREVESHPTFVFYAEILDALDYLSFTDEVSEGVNKVCKKLYTTYRNEYISMFSDTQWALKYLKAIKDPLFGWDCEREGIGARND